MNKFIGNFLFYMFLVGLFAISALIFVSGAILVPYRVYSDFKEYRNYTVNGRAVKCTAVSVDASSGSKYITAVYTDDDGGTHTAHLTKNTSSIRSGDTFMAYVLPDSPDELWVKNSARRTAFKALVNLLAFILGIAIPLIVLGFYSEQKILKDEGKPVVGKITDIYIGSNGEKYGSFCFQTERGEEHASEVHLKQYHNINDDINVIYAYDKRGKIHWLFK